MTTTRTDTAELVDRFRGHIRRSSSQGRGGSEYTVAVGHIQAIARPAPYGRYEGLSDAERLAEICAVLDALDAAQQEESAVTEDCPRCRHWTPAQRKWHHCIGCDGTGQVPAQQEESTR